MWLSPTIDEQRHGAGGVSQLGARGVRRVFLHSILRLHIESVSLYKFLYRNSPVNIRLTPPPRPVSVLFDRVCIKDFRYPEAKNRIKPALHHCRGSSTRYRTTQVERLELLGNMKKEMVVVSIKKGPPCCLSVIPKEKRLLVKKG